MGDDGRIAYAPSRHRLAHGRRRIGAFYLRIADVGGYRYPGADLGILVTRGRFLDDDHELVDRARSWITVSSRSSAACRRPRRRLPIEPRTFGFKML